MDDPYGCLRSVKITPELSHYLGFESGKIKELSPGEAEKMLDYLLAVLRSEFDELHLLPSPRKISRHLSWRQQSCQEVFENDRFQEPIFENVSENDRQEAFLLGPDLHVRQSYCAVPGKVRQVCKLRLLRAQLPWSGLF